MQLFAILPYLKTSGAVAIRGIDFRSSAEVDSLPQATKQHLSILFSMFFLKDELRIKHLSYACLDMTEDDTKNRQVMQRLAEIHHLLAYLYSSPHPTFLEPFLNREHANLYTFTPAPVSQFLIRPNDPNLESVSSTDPYPTSNERREIPGYLGSVNNESRFWVVEGSRIYPPSSHFWLNLSQDLYADLMGVFPSSASGGLQSLIETGEPRLGPIQERVFLALKWYNRSNSIDTGDDVALLHLAIAFESLLALEQGPQITQRFKESVGLLVGPVPKLESWASQFYLARSKIAHEGSSADLMFYATRGAKGPSTQYRSLVSYGRSIFRICLNAVAAGADTACRTGLASLLVTNQERFEKICKVLDHTKPGSSGALLSLSREILDIDEYKFVGEENLRIDTMLAAIKLAAGHFVATKPDIPSELLALYSCLGNPPPSSGVFEELDMIVQITEHIGSYEPTPDATPTDTTALVFSLTRSVHHYTFMQYYVLKSARDKKTNNPQSDME
jgi:hypothetical protein